MTTDFNTWADYWYETIGVNVIPADTQNKRTWVKWGEWQIKPILEDQHKRWKAEGAFNQGLGIIVGKIWRGKHAGQYLIFIDADNQKAIDEICTRQGYTVQLGTISTKWIVEQHRDAPNKAHIYVISPIPFPKKSSDSPDPAVFQKISAGELPAIEIKGEGIHGIAYCTPSLHKSGNPYEIIGTKDPLPLTEDHARDLLDHINNICIKYGIKYLEGGTSVSQRTPIEELFKPEFKVYEGNNRHEALMRAMESLIRRNAYILPIGKIKELSNEWNKEHCIPPLPDSELDKQWISAVRFMEKKAKDELKRQAEEALKVDKPITKYVGQKLIGEKITVSGKIHQLDAIQQIKTGDKFKDRRWIQIILDAGQSDEIGFWLSLTDELVDLPIALGDVIKAVGTVKISADKGKQLTKEDYYFTYLDVERVELLDEKLDVQLTDEDRAKFKEWAEKNNVIQELVSSFVPHIYGQDLVKECILYQIVGANFNGSKDRGDIHVMIIGDPSEGKTELAIGACDISGGRYCDAVTVSRAGIGAGVETAKQTGRSIARAGVRVLAAGKFVAFDEIDKMPAKYRKELLTILQNGFYKLDMIVHATFKADGPNLCTGNPKFGKYDPYKNIGEQIDFEVPFLTRFDLIFILRRSYIPEKTDSRLRTINERYLGTTKTKYDEYWIRKYLLHAKEITDIEFEPRVFEIISTYYHKLEKSAQTDYYDGIPITERQYHGMIRLAVARAKLHLRNKVLPEDAARAIEIMSTVMGRAGVDVATGMIDLGTLENKPQSKVKEQKIVLEIMRGLGVKRHEDIGEKILVEEMVKSQKWATEEAAKTTLDQLVKDFILSNPRNGFYSVV